MKEEEELDMNEANDASATTETAQQQQEDAPVDELQKAKDELAESKDKYIRLYSEFENFRRRTSKEKLDMIQNANEQLLKSLLPVVDDFERAELASAGASTREVEGFLLIQSKLAKILEQIGVKPMPLERGSDFDADTQEAITQIPAPEDSLKGKVMDVVEKGYLLNDKVIRYAKVVIGS